MEGHVSRLTADHDRGYPARRAHFTGKIANSKKRPISFSRPKRVQWIGRPAPFARHLGSRGRCGAALVNAWRLLVTKRNESWSAATPCSDIHHCRDRCVTCGTSGRSWPLRREDADPLQVVAHLLSKAVQPRLSNGLQIDSHLISFACGCIEGRPSPPDH